MLTRIFLDQRREILIVEMIYLKWRCHRRVSYLQNWTGETSAATDQQIHQNMGKQFWNCNYAYGFYLVMDNAMNVAETMINDVGTLY